MEAVRKEVRPYIYWLGFQIDRRPKEERSWRWRVGSVCRQRGPYIDEVDIQWEKYDRPQFMINFWTSHEERMIVAHRYVKIFTPDHLARIYPRKASWRDPWYGAPDSTEKTVKIARARLAEMDLFLKTGAPTTHLDWRKNCFPDRRLK